MATLSNNQLKVIGDTAARNAGGDSRAGAAAVAQAQAAARKSSKSSDAVFEDAIRAINSGTTIKPTTKVTKAYTPSLTETVNPASMNHTEDTYANQYYYQNNLPKTSDYEYSSRYQAPSGPGSGVHTSSGGTTHGGGGTTFKTVGDVITDMLNQSSSGGGSSSKNPNSTGGGSSGGASSGSSGGSKPTINSGNFGSAISSGGVANKAQQLIFGLPVEAQRAALEDIQSLADLYGIDYNRDSIESVFKDATNAAHEANLKEYARTARQYYDKLGATQNSLIDTLRKQRAASITSGANAGMQNATELSEILGLTQTVSPDALALAQDRNALIEAYNAQLAQDVHDAMEYSDQLKQALAALASEKYGYDAQQYVAELSHNANVQAQNTASSAAYTGSKYATLEDILGLAVVPSLTYTKKE